jgi:hypothetical protein
MKFEFQGTRTYLRGSDSTWQGDDFGDTTGLVNGADRSPGGLADDDVGSVFERHYERKFIAERIDASVFSYEERVNCLVADLLRRGCTPL